MPQLPDDVALFFTRKRSRKVAKARIRLQKQRRETDNRRRLLDKAFGPRSKIIEMLAKHASKALPASPFGVVLNLGKRFSMIDAPKEAIELICGYAAALNSRSRLSHVKFDHGRLEQTDLAANAILDLVTVERRNELRRRGSVRRLTTAGVYPQNQEIRGFIRVLGIIKHLGIKHEAPTPAEAKRYKIFDARNRHYRLNPDSNAADFKDLKQKKFVDFIDGCLKRCNNWTLSDQGKQSLGQYTGEILANAEDHPEFVDWSVLGYLDMGAGVPTCEIAIFNFGKSIAETFLEMDRKSAEWEKFGKYIQLHTENGFFERSWREQDLLTVIALQQHVSSKHTPQDTSRGQGTVYFMEFFQDMYELCTSQKLEKKAQMTLISGSTYILFDGTYRLADGVPGTGKTIAFNQANDLNERPDPKYVHGMNGVHFPGTIISVRFPFTLGEGAMVEELQDEKNDN